MASLAILARPARVCHTEVSSWTRSVAIPLPSPAHPLGERVAAAGRPAHADRHGAARRRGAGGARGRPAPRRACASRTSSCCSPRITISTTSASRPRSSAARAPPWPCSTGRPTTPRATPREVDEDRQFARALMRHHGVPEQLVAESEAFWDFIRATTEDFRADVRLADGDAIRAGGREPAGRRAPGPQHDRHAVRRRPRRGSRSSATTCWRGSPRTRRSARPTGAATAAPRSRVRYLENLRRTARCRSTRLLTGHGEPVTEHRRLVAARLRDHHRRCERILAVLERRSAHRVRDRRRPVARAHRARAAAARRLGGARPPRAAAGGRRRPRARRRPTARSSS